MAARTALVPVTLVRDSFTDQGAGATPDAGNGNTLPDPGANALVLIVKNADSAAHSVTVRATGSGNDASGNAQSVPPQNTVFTMATKGDLVVAVPAGKTYISPPLETDRFTQKDGSLSLDWSASASMTVWALYLPTNRLGGPLL
ncbi:MAG: hypothetical protein JWO67_6723 [Streptosporangiaceae bacterium]|nr:hypothetical protein [Streptosporangiaceae bacterium]